MGSLASVPKISTTPQPQPKTQVRYVTAKQPPSGSGDNPEKKDSGTSSSTPSTNDSGGKDKNSTAVSQERETNLLRRSRGRTGTIRTSFRGLLGLSDEQQRKTLLGE